MVKDDIEAWKVYPFHRMWFNKLWVSEKFKYTCGPCGVPVPHEGKYIVRPIYNLYGMGAGAKIINLKPEDSETVPPGYFWCEVFEGDHFSVELTWNRPLWKVTSVFQGHHASEEELFRFSSWEKVTREIYIPDELNELWDCGQINIELIGNKIIEVHLRGSPDPTEYTEFVPIWNDTPKEFIESFKSTHKFLEAPDYVHSTSLLRKGFYVK